MTAASIILPVLVILAGATYVGFARAFSEYRRPWSLRAFGEPSPQAIKFGIFVNRAAGIALICGGIYWFIWLNV